MTAVSFHRPILLKDFSGNAGSTLLRIQNIILQLTATGASLQTTCVRLCEEVEAILPEVICSVLTVDLAGLLHPLASPSLPNTYSKALEGAAIGPLAGSCGCAAYFGTDVVVTDIDKDIRWSEFKHLARPHGLAACWSSPIRNADGRTVATFAFYYREHRGPTAFEKEIVASCVHLCLIAIDRHQRVVEHERRAFTDALTGLPNRAAFNAALLALNGKDPGSWGLLVLDLDNLKVVNDTLGITQAINC